ncbi:MAG: preprotein translocase subunit SecA [Phycisphaerae bacterium]|nr:preprotein translocase subunit SecA [Phycisphaerae bacterium]
MAEHGIPIIGPILNKIIGTRNERFVKMYTTRTRQMNDLDAKYRSAGDAELRVRIKEFRERYDAGEKIDQIMVEAFAVAREAMDRAVGIRQTLNPARNFDASRLPEPMRALHAQLRAQADALPPAEPTGPYQGCAQAQPGWMQVEIPPEYYEAVRELYPESKPPFRSRPFDVQLIGGMVLAQGKIAEMRTGEGKTIVAPLAAYLAAIQRRKVHVVTVNDYLVQRDRDWTFPYFWALGLTVGAIHPQHMQDENEKRVMYRCDVVYGTTAEFGFDFLRDNMKRSAEAQVQKRRDFAIVDEVDSILIDEARTPLIISGPAHEDQPRYELADRLARHLVERQKAWNDADEGVTRCKQRIRGLEGDIRQARDKARIPELQEQLRQAKGELPGLESHRDKHTQYYEVQLERKDCHLTHEGVAEAQRAANVGSFYVDQNMDLPHLLKQALRAHSIYQLDRDYVIMTTPDPMTGRPSPSIVIVDVNTGRPMIGRQWSEGLHQAVECKEKVPIKQETQTVATITIQNFFKMYRRLSGMTGTADTEAQEFHDIYKLDVVAIPTNKAVIRRDHDDLVYLTGKDKWDGIVDEVKRFHDVGRPILVGTTSVEKSELLSRMLTGKHGVKHEVLNAKQHEREAHIIENAGQLGAVMIATNMAGRGTDIKLAAISRAQLLDHWLKRGIAPRTVTVESSEQELREGVYRKIAAGELELPGKEKREVEALPFEEIETRLLRKWAMQYTWASPGSIDRMSAEQLRQELDAQGRFILHRIRWFESIEDMGGLHVIGTERHEARRIDNQLRGRSGRQGDKGSSRFYVSLEDDLMKLFGGETMMKVLARLGMKEGDAIEHPMLSKRIEGAQRKVEERNFQIRKNVLEYDEVMEHQRRSFYGLRQRVLEGRAVKDLIFEFIAEATENACDSFLHQDYPYDCVAEYARQKLDYAINADRLKGLEPEEIEPRIRRDALDEARHMIDLTLGEYMPVEGSEASVDFDTAGLIDWAKGRFGVTLDAESLHREGGGVRRQIADTLGHAAEEKIAQADLGDLPRYTVPDYGARVLCEWVKEKFGIDLVPEQVLEAQRKAKEDPGASALNLILDKARELYAKREIEYPVDYAVEMTMVVAREQGPMEAMAQLASWARRSLKLEITPEQIKTMPPQKVRQVLLDASRKAAEENALERQVEAAQAHADDDALDAHLKARLGGLGITESMRYLEGEERQNAIRARVENIMRAELLYFERSILLDTLDRSWQDHLYAMDQLRDMINFRAYSQQDPRIEYKREGSQQFRTMMEGIRDRVTEYVFKAKVSPLQQFAQRAQQRPAPPPRQPAPARVGAGSIISGPGFAGGTISGPGMPQGPSPT